jgi:hypothetical protein
MNPHYPAVARRAGHRCEYCRAPEALFNFPFEVDHVCPVARGGKDSEENLALTCRACNVFKADYQTARDEVTGVEVAVFDPRRDRWDEHFRADIDTGEIHGLTPTGRATVARLNMNDPVQSTARQLWIRLRLFP